MSNVKTVRRLPQVEVERLADLMREDALAGFASLWYTLEPGWDELESVRPGDYAIPRDQATLFIDAMSESVERWTAMGLWLNQGPGTID